MRKSYPCVLFFVSCIVLLHSCQTEIDPNITVRGSGSDSILLKQLILRDTTLPVNADTLEKVSFFYDSNKRLVLVWDSNYAEDCFDRYDYYYKSNDTLPYKSIWTSKDPSFLDIVIDTTYFFYVNGFVQKDSTITYSLTNNSNYGTEVWESITVNSASIKVRKTNYSFPPQGSFVDSILFTRNYLNGNVIKQYPSKFGGPFDDFDLRMAYDNKPSPLYRKIIHYPLLGRSFAYLFEQPNNPTEYDMLSLDVQIRITYLYQLNGYPKSATLHRTDYGTVEINKLDYIYY